MSILSPRILTLIIVFAFVLVLVAIRSCVVLKHERAALDLIRHDIDAGQMQGRTLLDASVEATYQAGSTVVNEIVDNWAKYRDTPPGK
jgi:hypothetical protein